MAIQTNVFLAIGTWVVSVAGTMPALHSLTEYPWGYSVGQSTTVTHTQAITVSSGGKTLHGEEYTKKGWDDERNAKQ